MKLQYVTLTIAALGFVAPPAYCQTDADPFAVDKKIRDSERKPTRQELYDSLSKLIQVQIEWIEMDHATLTDLMLLRDPKGDSTALRMEVHELAKKGKAEILETAICLCRSGQKATTESIEEKIYPTEYEPAEIATGIEIHGNVDSKSLGQLVTPPTPTAFETRNVGTTLEIEAIIGADNKTIDLRLAPEIVIDTGVVKWQTVKDSNGVENHIQMPLFYSMRMSTGLTLRDGEFRFAGLHTPEGENGEADRKRKVMMFVKGDIVAPGEEDLPPAEKKKKK